MNSTYIFNILLLLILLFTIINLQKINKESFSEGVAGTSFVSRVPKGLVSAYYPGTSWDKVTLPPGWTLCDGTNQTPDLRGKFVLGFGQGSNLTSRNLGDVGGEENHKLIVSEMPSHSHKTERVGAAGYGFQGSEALIGSGSTDVTGGDQPHNNMPPFFVLVYIMKT